MKNFGILLVFVFLVLASCNETKKKTYLPGSIGAINSVAVVIDNQLWEGAVGDKIREHFAAPVPALIWEEPLFTINQMTPSVFTGTIRSTRAVLYIQKDSLSIAHLKKDMYATPQKVAVIKGTTEEEIIQSLDAKSNEIIAAFKNLEINEAQKRFLLSLNKEQVLQEKFGISLSVPSIYKLGRQEDNFVWMYRQIQKGEMSIIVYAMPLNSFQNDSTFVKDIIHMRDSIGEKYIPGQDVPGKITYMITEKAFAPYVFSTEIGDKKGVEVKGIWEIHGYPMAGPFITYILNDPENNRKLVLEGFTFAPATEKRDYMFELEAILKTVKFEKKTK